jgi:putative hydrolase of the HAD superfamily
MIEALIFDFGRVISAQKPESLFRGYERDLGLEPGTINPIMFDSRAWQETLLGHRTLEEYWAEIGPRLRLHDAGAIAAFRARYEADEAVNPGVRDLIRGFRGRYKLAVLSNSPRGLRQWVAKWGMIEWFEVVFCSAEEGMVKPHPQVFHRTLDRLQAAPREAVFIDDTEEHVAAARALGIHGLLFTDSEQLMRELGTLLAFENGERQNS